MRLKAITRKALEYYQMLINLDPANKNARSRIASIFVKQKEYDKAINVYEELSGIDREDLSVRVRYWTSLP